MGIIELPITVGEKPFQKTMMLDFIVVEEKTLTRLYWGDLS